MSIAVKIDCRQVRGLPAPRPMVEIYMHSPVLEGVHLRGGRVARGGIRWSDRPDDFRAEILGLMQTQMLKNAIIVPVGSKGGFVLKDAAGRRQSQDAYLVDRYREFISGLLDVTDNRVNGAIAHPPAVVRYDDDDPYLVVAADKGTAHLSDTANQVSAQYGFWLGDAFASGGSNGYDHKKEAITARGAWASVEHHFRLLGDRSRDAAVHRRRHRRHVRRRLRQRSAAEPDDEAGRRLQSSTHLSRSQSGSGDELRRARAAVPPSAIVVARLQHGAASARAAASSIARPRRFP